MSITRNQVEIIPTYDDLFPHFGKVDKKTIIKCIKKIKLNDCLLILSKLSRHHLKYAINEREKFRILCFELLNPLCIAKIKQKEIQSKKEFNIIFPEISILHLVKLCLKYCDKSEVKTTTEVFPSELLHKIGKCLLITNAIMSYNQIMTIGSIDKEDLLINITKQLIVTKNIEINQKLYQSYFIFQYLIKYIARFDIERIFFERYELTVNEYFAFLYLVYSQFCFKNTEEEDYEMPYINQLHALDNLKPKYNSNILQNFIFDKKNARKINMDFFNMRIFCETPLIEISNGNLIPIHIKQLFLGLTDGVYFQILNSLDGKKKQSAFSQYFGYATEDYFREIVYEINKKAEYLINDKGEEVNDAIIHEKEGLIFLECKKRQFHTQEFISNGTAKEYYERINQFFYEPLDQICRQVNKLRNGKLVIKNVPRDEMIYPIIVYPSIPPILPGAWNEFKLDKYILPKLFERDKNIAKPEFMDLTELECVEQFMSDNPTQTLIDLIKKKRQDESTANANWIFFLDKNNMGRLSKRLLEKYLNETENFKKLLFNS